MTEPVDRRGSDAPLTAEREGVATLPQKAGKESFTDKLSQLKSLVSAERAAVGAPVCVSVGAALLTCMHLWGNHTDTRDMPHCTCACIGTAQL